jgi:hypothetical protein
VTALYSQVPLGAIVEIVPNSLPRIPNAPRGTVFTVDAPKPEKAGLPATRVEPAGKTVRKSAEPDEQPHFGRGA